MGAFQLNSGCIACRWDQRITYVILPTLVRSVKSLAGMAGGRWILQPAFIQACASAESLVEPVSPLNNLSQ